MERNKTHMSDMNAESKYSCAYIYIYIYSTLNPITLNPKNPKNSKNPKNPKHPKHPKNPKNPKNPTP